MRVQSNEPEPFAEVVSAAAGKALLRRSISVILRRQSFAAAFKRTAEKYRNAMRELSRA